MGGIIGLVDYGKSGNTFSVNNALLRAGANVVLVKKTSELEAVDKIVLPGVGSFADAVDELKANDFLLGLVEHISRKPTLGICLGMQLLAKFSNEFRKTAGLSLIDGEVVKVVCDAPTPHMGFNRLIVQKKCSILEGIEEEEFYFMHSYEMVNYTEVVALTSYSDHRFVSMVSKKHIYGVQFHPEKSREAGIKLLQNFIKI